MTSRKSAPAPARDALGSRYKTRKRDRRREEILEAAAEVFSEKGYHRATLKDIADRVHMLPAGLYHYVASKDEALLEVCRTRGERFIRHMRPLLDAGGPAGDRLAAAIVRHMAANRRELVYSFAFRRRDLPPQVAPELAALSHRYQDMWEDLIRQGIEAGEFRAGTDPRLAAMALLAMCNGAIDWLATRGEAEIADAARAFAALALDGLRG
jgi:AcrR family transcriptional regulator